VLGRLTGNQRSWMQVVAGVTGGSVLPDSVYQPNPHAELLVPFPTRPPGDELLARARELGASRVGIWLAAPDPEIEAALPALGFTPGWQPHWMSAPAMAAATPDTRVTEPDEPPPEYDDYGQALFGLTRQRPQTSSLFVAREADGRFAGHAWLHVAAGVGGLYDVFVPEQMRRRGIGSALSNAASAKAADLGIDTVTLNAEFTPLYESLSFRTLGHGRTWWLHLK
jgi:GNAT superfamily N-acetyltransferase